MPANKQDWKQRFLMEPPSLQGGVALSVSEREGRLRLQLRHKHVKSELDAAFLSVPYPSGLRRLLANEPELEAVVVERAPSGFDEAAQEAGISYLDRRGFGRIIAPGFVYIASSPAPARIMGGLPRNDLWEENSSVNRQLRAYPVQAPESRIEKGPPQVSPFAPKASRLVRALLADPERQWRLSQLASEVDVDPGNAHRVLASLIEMGMIERDDERYLVPDPGSLLEAWAEMARPQRDLLPVALEDDLRLVLVGLLEMEPDGFRLSGEFAAELMAPYLPSRQALLYCLNDSALNAVREVSGGLGPNIRSQGRLIAVAADERIGDFGPVINQMPLVSPAQLYVDLYRSRGRAREAAEHVRKQLLRY